jgi:hypothetical protein
MRCRSVGSGILTVTNSTISNNIAGTGGGVLNFRNLTVSNSTISNNSASIGAGIHNYGDVTVSNSTISDNRVASGGGIYNERAARLAIGNTILKQGQNIVNEYRVEVTSLGYNLCSDNGNGVLTGPGDQINTHPMLGPLQNNGGPTETHALLPGSPAIDRGNPSFTPPPEYDQRGPGYPRVGNGRIEIGAFEVQ